MQVSAEEYAQRIVEIRGLLGGDLADILIAGPAANLLASIKHRIADEGLNTAGESIGAYSEKPLYATVDKFVESGAFLPGGKKGIIGDRIIQTHQVLKKSNVVRKIDGVFIGGKQLNPTSRAYAKRPKYSLVKNNYQERKSMYLANGYKELRAIQNLRTDIMNWKYSGQLLGTFTIEKQGLAYVTGFTSELSAQKRAGLEGRFGRTFSATEGETQQYLNEVNYKITRLIRDGLNGTTVSPTIDFQIG